jgi:hypothetical protein
MASAALVASLVVPALAPTTAIAEGPITWSTFAGAENPLSESGAWVPMFSMSPDRVQFQKNNGAYAGSFNGAHNNHPTARTTAAVPADQYSEIVVGHIGTNRAYVGPMVRVQTGGPAVDSQYTWWASLAGGDNLFLYRFDCDGTRYNPNQLIPHSPVVDGDRLRLIARGPVIYGVKNGVRDFIYNTGKDNIRYDGGTTGILAYSAGPTLTDATIAEWSTGAAPASSGTWASSNFAGTEDPLDEGDRWYPLPGFTGFKKVGGLAMSNNTFAMHNISGVWGIASSATQYSEVTLGAVPQGGGGPVVRIDRTNLGPTGWLLFLWSDPTSSGSGIYKINPVPVESQTFTLVRPFTPTVIPGDKWRLAANGNTLEVFQNGVSQFTYTTDGAYPSGDVGIEAYSQSFTFRGWEGGDLASPPPPSPAITGFAPTSGPVGTSVQINGTNFDGASAVTFGGVSASYAVTSSTVIQASVPSGARTGPIVVTTPAGTATSASAFTVTVPPPTVTNFAPTSGPVGTSVQINGTNFDGASKVTFNGANASFTVTSSTTIQATVPAAATTGRITVTTPGGAANSPTDFTVFPGPPTVTSFAPTSGAVGTSVLINGTNFGGASNVSFNGVTASFTVTSATSIRATVPAAATSGPIRVTTPGGAATSANSFTVMARLSVAKTSTLGVGQGTVVSTSSPGSANQIDCGPSCSVDFAYGTVVTLTATPDLLSVFDGWTGCDSSSGSTCTVTLKSARTVTARFLP